MGTWVLPNKRLYTKHYYLTGLLQSQDLRVVIEGLSFDVDQVVDMMSLERSEQRFPKLEYPLPVMLRASLSASYRAVTITTMNTLVTIPVTVDGEKQASRECSYKIDASDLHRSMQSIE